MDRTKDIPNARKQLFKALGLMKERKDWNNLPSILIGLKNAGVMLAPWQDIAITRKAGAADRIDVILECARRGSNSAFLLRSYASATEIMWQLQHKAVGSNWAATETEKAFSWAESISNLLEDPQHSGGKVVDAERDVRVQPSVIGILLQLSAARAILFQGGEDCDGKVAQYTARLLGSPAIHMLKFENWQQRFQASQRQYVADLDIDERVHDPIASNEYLTQSAPVLHGLKLALKISGPVEGLKNLEVELEDSIAAQRITMLENAFVTTSDGQQLRGLRTYDELLGLDAKQILPLAIRPNSRTETQTEGK